MKVNVKKIKLTLLTGAVVVIFGIIGVKALLAKGYYTSHDAWHQVVRLHYFDKAIRDGAIPPGFVNGLFFGYGYPLFIFSYHLPWIIALPFTFLGFSVFDSIKAVYFIGFILSGITMFVFLRRRFGNLESFVGSLLYMWAPYHFSNIFVRGSIGEATIFIFIPLLFLAIDSSFKQKSKKIIVLGSFSVAAIILSHAIVSLLVLGSALLYSAILLIFGKKRLVPLKRIFVIYILGFLLSSYYLIPAVYFKQFTQFSARFQTQYQGHFASITELIYSKWGYAFSQPRAFDSMSFQVGIAQWISVFLVFFYLFLKRGKVKYFESNFALIVIFALSIFFILPQSSPLWSYIVKNIFPMDFPWRLLTIVVFSASALSAYLVFYTPNFFKIVISLLLVIICLYTNRNHLRVNKYTDIPLSLYLASERTTNTRDEYMPKWANAHTLEKLNKGGEIEADNDIEILEVEKKINRLSFNYKSDSSIKFTVHLLFFPGWQVFIDNMPVDISFTEAGLITFPGVSGEHFVRVVYSGTTLTQASNLISISTLIILVIFLLKDFKKSKRISFVNQKK